MCPKTLRILISCAVVAVFQQAASAGVIDTLPPTFWIGDNPPRCIGGTFQPIAPVLEQFTISLDDGSGAQYFRPVVFSTDALGTPDALLWAGPDTYKSSYQSQYDAFPALAVDPASRYFIGFDTGRFTSVTPHSGYLALGIRTDNPIPQGSVYFNAGGGWIQEPGNDIAARITMAVPEPGAVSLVAIGSVMLLIGVCRRRRGR